MWEEERTISHSCSKIQHNMCSYSEGAVMNVKFDIFEEYLCQLV